MRRQLHNCIVHSFPSKHPITLSNNVIHYNPCDKMVRLSKNQIKLFTCLLSNRSEKEDIIQFIWGEGYQKKNELKYNQLIYRTRTKLIRLGLPNDLILTIPGFGVCLNKTLIPAVDTSDNDLVDADVSAKVMYTFI